MRLFVDANWDRKWYDSEAALLKRELHGWTHRDRILGT